MPEEVYRIKAVLDFTELQGQLQQARSEIQSAVSEGFSAGGGPSVSDIASSVVGGAKSLGQSIQDYTSGALQGLGGYGAEAFSGIQQAYSQLPQAPSGERVRDQILADSVPFTGGWEIDRPLYDDRRAARKSWLTGALGINETATTTAGLAMGSLGFAAGMAIPIPGVNVAAGLALSLVGDTVGRAVVQPVTDLLTDEERWRQHFQLRDTVESSIGLGLGATGRGASGLVTAGLSSRVATSMARRAYESRHLNTQDMMTITSMAGSSGLLSGVTAGADNVNEAADSISKRLEDLEGRVVRIRRTLGTDTAGAMGALTSGIMMGMSEQQAEAGLVQSSAVARSAAVTRGQVFASMQQGSSLFQSVGLDGAAGAALSGGALMRARQLIDSGDLDPEVAMRMGGVAGIAGHMQAQTAGFLSTGLGGAIALGQTADPGMLSSYLSGDLNDNQVLNAGRKMVMGAGTRLDQLVMRDRAAERMSDLPPALASALRDRQILNEYSKRNPKDEVSSEKVQAWLRLEKGMTRDQAKTQAAMVMQVHNDPEKLASMANQHAREVQTSEAYQAANLKLEQIRYDSRRELMDMIPGRGLLKTAREAWIGKPGDESGAEDYAENEMFLSYRRDLGDIMTSDLTDEEKEQAAQDLQLSFKAKRRRAERENSGWLGKVSSWIGEGVMDNFVVQIAEEIPFSKDWAAKKLVGRDEGAGPDKQVENEQAARAMEMAQQSGVGGLEQIMLQQLAVLHEIRSEI